jgi:hypothetical protein
VAHTPPDHGQGVKIVYHAGLLTMSNELRRSPADDQQFLIWNERFETRRISGKVWSTRHPCDRELKGCSKLYLGQDHTIGNPDTAHWGAVFKPVGDAYLLLAFGRRHPADPTGRPLRNVYDVATDVLRLINAKRRTL